MRKNRFIAQEEGKIMTSRRISVLKQGERPAAALRAAQVEMWKQKS